MTVRLLAILALAAASPGFAQLRFFTVAPGGAETMASTSLDLGRTAPGDQIEVRLRVRNVGTAAIALQSFSAEGSGVSVNGPGLPLNIAPGTATDLYLRFSKDVAGSYVGRLLANALSLSLAAVVAPAPVLTAEGDAPGSRIDIAAGTAIYLGRVQRGQRSTRSLCSVSRHSRKPTAAKSVLVPFSSSATRAAR